MDPKAMVDTTPIERMVERLGANSIFGEPTKEHDAVIIPVAQVEYGFGFGGGYGEGGDSEDSDKSEESGEGEGGQEETGSTGEGGGGGGGAGGRATPRGYIRITPDEVSYEPIQDENRIPLAGIVMVAWSVFWVMATVRYIAKVVGKTKQANR